MDTIELTLSIPPPDHDRFIGWLENCATGFMQEEAQLRAYVPADRWVTVDREKLEARLAAHGYPDALSIRPLAAKNWNAAWEETLSPIRAGPFLVAPPSPESSPEDVDATVLHIHPQMSFGTGHHATTRLALELLADAVTPGDCVLDVGTGTGILAIAACRSGAASAFGVDTSSDAVRNARANALRNEVADCVTVREGSLEAVSDPSFDVVAANVTRRLLLDLLPDLVAHLADDGQLLLSGVLDGQQASILDAASSRNVHLVAERTENGWWAARFSRVT